MRILIVDNYDSFTYNLYHLLNQFVDNIEVIRNDKIDLYKINKYDKIVLSPGPGLPSESNLMIPLIKDFSQSKSILGICLGCQAIGQVFGCNLLNLSNVKHGISSKLTIIDPTDTLFKNIQNPIHVGHYHSWVIDHKFFSEDLKITAKSNDLIMAISHKTYDLKGLQFHPESILTNQGTLMVKNWLFS